MKASTFIKTALIDQMQIIADAGLWFHLAKLIPSGVEVLARVKYSKAIRAVIELPDKTNVRSFHKEFFPEYDGKFPTRKEFFGSDPITCFLTSDSDDADHHLSTMDNGIVFVHVPKMFVDFKTACETILAKIESGECQDIDVFKSVEP